MESFFTHICEQAPHAHWIIFGLLMLGGLNLPISEDILILGGGAIAASCIPEHTVRLYVWIFMGAFLSDLEVYWLGRLLGPNLYKIPIIRSFVTQNRLDLLRYYYAKFGIFTFLVGRFCPGGVRNALFITSGFTKMPFYLFILRDFPACLLSTFVLFNIGYHFAENIDLIFDLFHRYTFWFVTTIISLITLIVITIQGIKYWKKGSDRLK